MYLESSKKFLYGVTVAAAIILLGISLLSCTAAQDLERKIINRFTSEESLDSAVEATQDFFDALMAKDYQQAYQMISSQDKQEHSYDQFVREFDDVTDIVFFEINWVEVKNNIAVVGIDFMDSYDGEEKLYKDQELSLIKEDGEWKINFWQ